MVEKLDQTDMLAMSDRWRYPGYQFCPNSIPPRGTMIPLYTNEMLEFEGVSTITTSASKTFEEAK